MLSLIRASLRTGALSLILPLVLTIGTAAASVNASMALTVKNTSGSNLTATSLTFNVHMWNWEGSAQGSPYYFTGWGISTTPGGNCATTPTYNPSNTVYAIDATQTGILIPVQTTIAVNINVVENQGNTLVVSGVTFSTGTSSWAGTVTYSYQWTDMTFAPGPHSTVFELGNENAVSLEFEPVEFYWAPMWVPAEMQWAGVGVLFQTTPSIFLEPGQTMPISVYVPFGGTESYIYARTITHYTVDKQAVQDTLLMGHQEQIQGGVPTENPSWGRIKTIFR